MRSTAMKLEEEPLMGIMTDTPVPKATRSLQLAVRDDHIGVITFDRPDSSANIFDFQTLQELAVELDFIERQTELRGLVLVSAKPSIFIAGADLKSMQPDTPEYEIAELIERGQVVMNRIAQLKIPTAAAIHGACVGGGYELCLACDYRVASPDRVTKIGLPETKIGLLPAWGGSTRLPRLIGLPKALDIILGGKTPGAPQALRLGMIDELAPKERLMDAAVRKIYQGKRHQPVHRLTNNFLVSAIIWKKVAKVLQCKTRGHYPAVLKAVEVASRGLSMSADNSLALERRAFLDLTRSETCRNLIRVFFMQERAKKRTVGFTVAGPRPEKMVHAAVVGAGVMGAGIAQWLSSKQLQVLLRDVSVEQVGKGMVTIAKLFRDGLKHHSFTSRDVRESMDRIFPAPNEVPLRHIDIVIEAASENLDLKKKIFQRLDQIAGENTILATNTSALPITEIARATSRPERVVGLHFFNPVHRMPLVEVIAGAHTSLEVLQRAVRFTQQIGKLPVVVTDSPGFLVNRILIPYLIEAGNLFEDGADIAVIDDVMLDFGMPMGPLRLLDEVGLDVALHVAETLESHFKDRIRVPRCLRGMTADGMLGRKNGRGFYRYETTKPEPNPHLSSYRTGDKAVSMTREELQERMVFLMLNEAARCMEEHVVSEPLDVDFAMIMGAGFAPFRGGPLRHTDAVGVARLAGAMDHLVAGGAAHFEPCALLRDMAGKGKKFYSHEERP